MTFGHETCFTLFFLPSLFTYFYVGLLKTPVQCGGDHQLHCLRQYLLCAINWVSRCNKSFAQWKRAIKYSDLFCFTRYVKRVCFSQSSTIRLKPLGLFLPPGNHLAISFVVFPYLFSVEVCFVTFFW